MTAEKILLKHTDKNYVLKEVGSRLEKDEDDYFSNMKSDCVDAMEEYSKQEAQRFAQWLINNFELYECGKLPQETEGLYDEFQKFKNQK